MEDSPVLLFRQETLETKYEDFVLIIMTEFQKHILMTSTKEVVCLDHFVHLKKNAVLHLTVLLVMDDQGTAFPVAFCLSRKIDKSIVLQFLSSIKESTGPLSCRYFMSNNNKMFYEAWQETMEDKSTWIWSVWSFEDNVRKYLTKLLKHIPTREATYRIIRNMMECNSQPVFTTMLKNFKNSLLDNQSSENFGKAFELHFGSNFEMWACCYRKDLQLSANIYLEFLHKTLRYCVQLGFKKRLDKFLMVLMKFVRYKMLNHLCNMMDEEKRILAKTAIRAYHNMGLEVETESINFWSDQVWMIRSENELDVYVTREYESCPEMCDLKCPDCDVCVHMYSCSCVQSLINANICQHIHAVVWKFLTPHFSPPMSPVIEYASDIPDDVSSNSDEDSSLFENIFKKMQGVYKQLKLNKCKLNKKSLSEVMKMMCKSYQICSNDEIPDNFLSKSTQTQAVVMPSESDILNGFSNIESNSTSENYESSAFMPMAPPIFSTVNSSVYENYNNPTFLPVTPPIYNNVGNSASEKDQSITYMSIVSNDTSESGRKISLVPVVSSDSASKSRRAKRRRLSKKKSVQGISELENFSYSSFKPMDNSTMITEATVSYSNHISNNFDNTQMNPIHQTSVVETDPVLVSIISGDAFAGVKYNPKGPCDTLSNSGIVPDPLSLEKPYLIKCSAPIIRTSKSRLKSSLRAKNNGSKKENDLKNLSTVNTSCISKPDNQSADSHFVWDSVSKRYFVLKDNGPTRSLLKPNQSSQISLDETSESPSVLLSDEGPKAGEPLLKSSISHSPIVLETPLTLESSPNHLPNPVYFNPLVVKTFIKTTTPSNHPCSEDEGPKAGESSSNHLSEPVSFIPFVVEKSLKTTTPSNQPCSVSHNPIVMKASIAPASSNEPSSIPLVDANNISDSNEASDIS